MSKIISGEVLCEYCPGERIELGKAENGETISMPTQLRRIVGRGPMNTLMLDCGHYVYVLGLRSAQETITFDDGSVLQNGHLPV
jgi:hypothetical protein